MRNNKPNLKNYFILAAAILFFLFNFSFAAQNDAQQQDLKIKINTLRNQIQGYQKEIYNKSQREETLQGDITDLEKDIAKMELQIQETQLVIQSLNLDIADKQEGIDAMQKEVNTKKEMLSLFMQELYEQGSATSIEMTLGSETFSDYFFQADSLESYE